VKGSRFAIWEICAVIRFDQTLASRLTSAVQHHPTNKKASRSSLFCWDRTAD
jgi:hypothetical protein